MLNVINTIIPSPKELKKQLPLKNGSFIQKAREKAKNIFLQKEDKICLVTGPCSIHNDMQALEYAKGLRTISTKHFFPVMRTYCEKPRTALGWKGLLNDPYLDSSNDIIEGLIRTRKLLLALAEMQIPCATEFLDPLVAPYIDDLITWGFIGARTAASQPHRLLASSLSFPIGFKNTIEGNIELAIQGAYVAQKPHVFLGINEKGNVCKKQSLGNPYTHIVLRGSNESTNYEEKSIQRSIQLLKKYNMHKKILIDCAHGNSQKCPEKQKAVFKKALSQILLPNSPIIGFMLESNLLHGCQPLLPHLQYGVSITDPCMSLQETLQLIEWAENLLEEKCLAQ